ncbi:MAG: GFA family protein, partial [Alphaproteobacteria bacterium]
MSDVHKGTCYCGAVEVTATGAPFAMGYCHCKDCRAWSAGP